MNFQELHNITENFCNTHSFEAFGEPVFDYDHQCYNYDIPNAFNNSLVKAAFENEKLTRILVRLTEKEILNNKEKSIIYILRNIESLLEKREQFEDEYIYQSNRARRARSYEELQSLYMNYNTVTRDVNHMIKEFYSLIEDIENGNIREDFETKQEYLQCVQEVMKENEEDTAKFEAQHQEYKALIADSLAKIKQQLSKLYPEANNMKLAS